MTTSTSASLARIPCTIVVVFPAPRKPVTIVHGMRARDAEVDVVIHSAPKNRTGGRAQARTHCPRPPVRFLGCAQETPRSTWSFTLLRKIERGDAGNESALERVGPAP